MPVLKAKCAWFTKYGRRRRIRLWAAWCNIHSRVRGINKDGHGNPIWKGLPVEWVGWPEFRAWALANGFSRLNNSLDRKEATLGYGPANCRWIPVAENSRCSMTNTKAKIAAKRAACAS